MTLCDTLVRLFVARRKLVCASAWPMLHELPVYYAQVMRTNVLAGTACVVSWTWDNPVHDKWHDGLIRAHCLTHAMAGRHAMNGCLNHAHDRVSMY